MPIKYMKTGRPMYFAEDGERLPSMTTVIGMLDKPALLGWANKVGREGLTLEEARETALTIGKAAHTLIEAYCKGEEISDEARASIPDDMLEAADRCFNEFAEWARAVDLQPISVEEPLVSEELRLGGTPDCIARVMGRVVLIDWKTSASIWPEHLIQAAGYRVLWEENYPETKIERIELLRLGKDAPSFDHHSRSLDHDAVVCGEELLRLLRPAYDLRYRLKKATG